MSQDQPYRTNAAPGWAVPRTPFDKRHPNCWKVIQWLSGMVGIGVLFGVLWIVFPGMYYFGGWLDRQILHWHLDNIHESPSRWLLGVGATLCIVALFFVPRRLGKALVG